MQPHPVSEGATYASDATAIRSVEHEVFPHLAIDPDPRVLSDHTTSSTAAFVGARDQVVCSEGPAVLAYVALEGQPRRPS